MFYVLKEVLVYLSCSGERGSAVFAVKRQKLWVNCSFKSRITVTCVINTFKIIWREYPAQCSCSFCVLLVMFTDSFSAYLYSCLRCNLLTEKETKHRVKKVID